MIPYTLGICIKCNAEAVIVKRHPKGNYCHKHNQERLSEGKEKKQYQIPKESKKRGKENREYLKARKEFLNLNPYCQANWITGEGKLICTYQATTVHHMMGRVGSLLTNKAYFLACCFECHQAIEMNPIEAKKRGYSLSRLESKQEIISLENE